MKVTKQMILDTLHEVGKPLPDIELFAKFDVGKAEAPTFLENLEALEIEGSVIRTKKNKYALPELMNLVLGTVSGTQKGFAFVMPKDKSKADIFIATGDLNGSMHGDTVYCKITGSRRGESQEGEIVKIIKRANEYVVGTFDSNENFGFVVPDNKKISGDIYIHKKGFGKAQNGQKVVVKITKWPEGRRNPEGEVSEVLGFIGEEGVDVLSVIRKYKLPESFPNKVEREANAIAPEVPASTLNDRKDLRGEQIITIDGIDAKDLDDAVQVKKLANGNYYLGVHIADVSHYVTENSKLDKEAFKRGTSVYLIDRVIPMLPKALSNGICSLNPDVDRLTMTCEMEIDQNGEVVKYDIYESVIKSQRRMNYKDVSDILESVEGAKVEEYADLIDMFKDMETLCNILREKRVKRGAIDFDFPEPFIELDEDGKPVRIVERERRIANRIIEEFMLAANETVAEHVFWLEKPFVYRIHEDPDAERIAEFNKFLHNFGYRLKGNADELHPKEVQRLLAEVKGKKEEHIINKLMLRALKQAKYSPICEGHFGLAAKYYSHFTSPIRRYPDLQIHRILKEMIHGKLTEDRCEMLKGIVEAASIQSSERERTAEQAERETDDMKKAEYMLDYIGETFEGMISSVTSFGIFTELDNTVEGLTRISMLEDDYYKFDQEHLRLLGERTKNVYTVGDVVKVRVERVDVALREVDFYILEKIERE